jgi:spermidine synthase
MLFLEIPEPFLLDSGVAKLLEPADANARLLHTRLMEGRYGRPFVLDHGGTRALYFSLGHVQSAMSLADPLALSLAYTRKMMAFLLFNPQPRRILMVGLGGGSLAKYCHHHLPETDITALEVDPDVLAFRDEFHVPPDDARFRVIQADAARYLADLPQPPAGQRFDVALVDAFDDKGVAPALAEPAFYQHLAAALGPRGVLVMNIAGTRTGYRPPLRALHDRYGERLLALHVKDDGNTILLAFNDPAFQPDWPALREAAQRLEPRFRLQLPHMLTLIQRAHTLRLVRRMLADTKPF